MLFIKPTAFVQDGEPDGSLDRPPCVEAPQMRKAPTLPPEQQTSASLLFQSAHTTRGHRPQDRADGPVQACAPHSPMFLDITPKSFRAASLANPA